MLDESDRLSLLALIVAVVALIVSAWQLAQQLFATATDGKRFCQGSVMGIWARKTRLSWRWSQIRFETKYTTPEIRMTSGIRDHGATSTGVGSTPRHSRLVYKIPILGWLSRVLNGPPEDWGRYFEVTTDRPDLPLEMQKTVRPRTDPSLNSTAEKLSWWKVKTWGRSYHEDSPDIVSWPIVLQWIYSSQVSAIRKLEVPTTNGKEDERNSEVDAKQSRVEDQEEHDEVPYRDILPEEKELKEDRVVVRLVERSWDLIPPDVVRLVLFKSSLRDLLHLSLIRPLAKSTIGTIIVIAHGVMLRSGMVFCCRRFRSGVMVLLLSICIVSFVGVFLSVCIASFMDLVMLLLAISIVIISFLILLLVVQLNRTHILGTIPLHKSSTLRTLLQITSTRIRRNRAIMLLSATLDTLIEAQMEVRTILVATGSGVPAAKDTERFVTSRVLGAVSLRTVAVIGPGFEVEVFGLTDWAGGCWVGYDGQHAENGGEVGEAGHDGVWVLEVAKVENFRTEWMSRRAGDVIWMVLLPQSDNSNDKAHPSMPRRFVIMEIKALMRCLHPV